jgi:hypothetical protein
MVNGNEMVMAMVKMLQVKIVQNNFKLKTWKKNGMQPVSRKATNGIVS